MPFSIARDAIHQHQPERFGVIRQVRVVGIPRAGTKQTRDKRDRWRPARHKGASRAALLPGYALGINAGDVMQ